MATADYCCTCVSAGCRWIIVQANQPFFGRNGIRRSSSGYNLTITSGSSDADKDTFDRLISECFDNFFGIEESGTPRPQEYGGSLHNPTRWMEILCGLQGSLWITAAQAIEFGVSAGLHPFTWQLFEHIDERTGVRLKKVIQSGLESYSYELDTTDGSIAESGDPNCLYNSPFPSHPLFPIGTGNVDEIVAAGGSASFATNGVEGVITVGINVPANFHEAGSSAYTVTATLVYAEPRTFEGIVAIANDELLEFVQIHDLTHVYPSDQFLNGSLPALKQVRWTHWYVVHWKGDVDHPTGISWPLKPFITDEGVFFSGPMIVGRLNEDGRSSFGNWTPSGVADNGVFVSMVRVETNGENALQSWAQYPMQETTNSVSEGGDNGHSAVFELLGANAPYPDWDLPLVMDCVHVFLPAGDHIIRPGDLIFQYGVAWLARAFHSLPNGIETDSTEFAWICAATGDAFPC